MIRLLKKKVTFHIKMLQQQHLFSENCAFNIAALTVLGDWGSVVVKALRY